MAIHPQDLQDIKDMTGDGIIPEGFEAEYVMWLRMYHRRKGSGPLGPLLVPLCRAFGMEPPPDLAAQREDWRVIARGSQVTVDVDGAQLKGRFVGIGDYGQLNVKLDGQDYVLTFKPHEVSLQENAVPSDVNLSQRVVQAMQYIEPEAPADARGSVDLPAEEEGPAEPERLPVSRMGWEKFEAGAPVLVGPETENPVEALFERVGPGDEQVTVRIGEDLDFFDEEIVIPRPSVNGKPKKPKKPIRSTSRKKKPVA